MGLGGMRLSWEYMLPHRERAIATLHTALDLGITLLDGFRAEDPTALVGLPLIWVARTLRPWTR